MVGTSKILTVSYGTFSCTLEGFDDSFSTMKAIAEYFRGLAADDRYFGAEPPTPDAEMLAQIAEREISRRVDASMGDDGIHLRAAALTDQSADASEAAENQHDKESRADVDAARKAAKAAKKAAKAQAKAEAKAAKEAEKAAKAEAVEAEAKAEAEATAKADEDAKAEADAIAKEEAKAAQQASEEDTASEISDDDDILSSVSAAQAATSEGTAGSEVEETRDDALSSVLAADDPAPAPDDPAPAPIATHPDSESVAAKLQRIRAVVGKSDKSKDAGSDDLTSQFLPKMETPDVADIEVEDGPVAEFDSLEAELDGEASAESDGGVDMISRVMSRQDDPTDADDASKAETPTPTPATDDVQDEAQPRTRVIRMKRSDFEKAKAEEASQKTVKPSSDSPDLGMLDGADELDDYLEDSDFADDVSFEDDADFSDNLAEIQSDFEAETQDIIDADGEAEDEDEDGADTIGAVAAAMAGQASSPKEDAISETVEVTEAKAIDVAEADDSAEETPQVDDAALDRLLSETDVQMQEPEGSRRRDAIAQLKAAVAAKEAARQVGEPDDDGQDVENAFRNDLSEVTHTEGTPRPRPVVRSATRTERPRPAPLKLVAAQRVDLEKAEKRDGPVVPRRIGTRAPDQAAKSAGSFAEFAENMGASELPDLLEAAAAYTAFVEGADEFSRPQILRRARSVASDEFNREDGLRSFADLLRSGRFTKVRNGRFQVADDSRYNPERRAG